MPSARNVAVKLLLRVEKVHIQISFSIMNALFQNFQIPTRNSQADFFTEQLKEK